MTIGFVYHPRELMHPKVAGKGGSDHVWHTPQTDTAEHTFYVLDLYNTILLSPNHVHDIPEWVLVKLRAGEWHLLMDCFEEYDLYRLESYSVSNRPPKEHMVVDTPLGRIVNFVQYYDIPQEHVHYASPFLYDDLMLSELAKLGVSVNINFHFRDAFLSLYSRNTIDVPQSSNEKLLYAALNAGDPKAPKVEMIYRLWKNDLLDDGLISLSNFKRYLPTKCEREFRELLPIRSDFVNKHWWISPDDRQQSELEEMQSVKIYISTETLAPFNYCFITEKTYRAIAYKKPFVIVGNRNSLKKLKDLGFQTFDKWWSEEYDTLEWSERIDWTIDFLKWIKQNNPAFDGIQQVTEYNYNHMMNTNWDQMFKTSLINAKKVDKSV